MVVSVPVVNQVRRPRRENPRLPGSRVVRRIGVGARSDRNAVPVAGTHGADRQTLMVSVLGSARKLA